MENDATRAAALTNYDRALKTCLADLSKVSSSTQSFSLVQNALVAIPFYNGSTPLKEFVQDIENFKDLFIDAASQKLFLRGLLTRLRGRAQDSLSNVNVQTVDELIKHLKDRFAPRRSYQYYVDKINSASLQQGETVQDFYDRLKNLVHLAAATAADALPTQPGQTPVDQTPQLELLALGSFASGLPAVYKTGMAASAPATLDAAFAIAKNIARFLGMGPKASQANLAFNRGEVIFDRFEEPTPHRGISSRPVSPAHQHRSTPTEAPHHEKNVKFMDIQDPQIFNRNIAYHYDRRDLVMPRTVITPDGRIQAPAALNYSRTPPGGILRRPASPGPGTAGNPTHDTSRPVSPYQRPVTPPGSSSSNAHYYYGSPYAPYYPPFLPAYHPPTPAYYGAPQYQPPPMYYQQPPYSPYPPRQQQPPYGAGRRSPDRFNHGATPPTPDVKSRSNSPAPVSAERSSQIPRQNLNC